MTVNYIADWITILGFPTAIIGLFFVYLQRRSDALVASASAINTVYSNINARVLQMTNAQDVSSKEEVFKDLLNDLELACALYLDGQFKGRTGDLSATLLIDILKTIDRDKDLTKLQSSAIHSLHTFKNIDEFKKLKVYN